MQRFQEVKRRLSLARDEAEVTNSIQEFLNAILPSELADLPDGVARLLISHHAEVPDAAVGLKREDLMFQGDDEPRTFLHEIAMIYEDATRRLSQIHSSRHRP